MNRTGRRGCALLLGLAWLTVSANAAAARERAFAGWYNLFPHLSPLLNPVYQQPIVTRASDDIVSYSQTAHYDAMTGLPRSFQVTVARDPELKKRYNATALQGIAAESHLGKRTVWTWNDSRKVVVLLGDDRAVTLTTDPVSISMPLSSYLKSFDFDRIEQALAKPPRTELVLTRETFAVFRKGSPIEGLHDWCGPCRHEVIGEQSSRQYRWTFRLKDDSTVVLISRGDRLESMHLETADGKITDLLE